MVLRMTDPFDALVDWQRALDSVRFSDWFGTRTTSGGAFPPINVFRRDDDMILVAEIAGADKGKIDIQVKNNQVRLSGNKEIDREEGVSTHRRERSSGEFNRVLTLPAEIDADKVKAEYRNGILTVLLPRAESDKPRSVSIA